MTTGTNPAHELAGLTLPGDWTVIDKIDPKLGGTGGHFSVCYKIKHKDGKEAFLKALDFSSIFRESDQTRALQNMLEAFNFEKDILNKCKIHRMKRVTTPLFDGQVFVPGSFGLWTHVSYLAFDLANGNIRKIKSDLDTFDLAWALRTLHYTAVGIRQLHQNGIVHQDLKPSNVLDFGGDGAKIGDLGRAKDIHLRSPFDGLLVAGDTNYVAPEYVYSFRDTTDDLLYKKRAELYQVGSLIFFFFSDSSARGALMDSIRQNLDILKGISSSFDADLPYLKNAFSFSIDLLRKDIARFSSELVEDILQLAIELCEPDPRERGNKSFPPSDAQRYDLERYISRINILAKKAEMGIR